MLYICATPIGNMKDITLRALEVLTKADIILCEDTRNSIHLLNFHNIANKKLYAFHEHNENEMSYRVVEWLKEGLTIVQISDAGTPGVSDPGARLCNIAFEHGFTPHPLPGPSAYLSLLSVSGLININSLFYGFLANKSSQRQNQLNSFKNVDYAVTVYESTHRIIDCVADIITVLGGDRVLIVGRELTKQFETVLKMSAIDYQALLLADKNQQRGEFVINILPAIKVDVTDSLSDEQIRIVNLLAQEMPTKKAVNIAHKIIGGNKDLMYQYLLDNKKV